MSDRVKTTLLCIGIVAVIGLVLLPVCLPTAKERAESKRLLVKDTIGWIEYHHHWVKHYLEEAKELQVEIPAETDLEELEQLGEKLTRACYQVRHHRIRAMQRQDELMALRLE